MKVLVIGILAMAAVSAMLVALSVERESRRRLREYWMRRCTGQQWRRRFPEVPKEEIREFLDAFLDGFAFKNRQRLKFAPDDKIMDVYRAIYPAEGWPDGLELETFASSLQKCYGFDLATINDSEVTLGKLFEMARTSRSKD